MQKLWREILEENIMEDGDEGAAKRRYNEYITKAKQKIANEKYRDALEYYKKARSLFPSDKLIAKIERLTRFIEETVEDSDDEDESSVETVNGFKINKICWDKLYPHQKEGVLWFWDLYNKKKGGILGDDMGLGKTIQVIAFLSAMFDQDLVHNALIVVPKSLMENWCNEFDKWAPGVRLAEFHGAKAKREKELDKVQRRDGIILTTYGLVFSSFERLSEHRGERFKWDYIILDEGHKIKNQNKTSKAVRCIPAKYHFILTGTPIQNNLSELWSLVDFVTEGRLLGTLKTFKTAFEQPIVRAREKDATSYEKQSGNEISKTLRKMLNKYFLRRTKAEVYGDKTEEHPESTVNGIEDGRLSVDATQRTEGKQDVMLARKSDFIVWLYLSDIQLKIYQDFLKTASVREAMVSTKSPLAQLTMLKKIADHPRLLSSGVCETLGLSENMNANEDVLIRESSKIQFLLKLLQNLKEENHRVLIFSQSRKMLDIVDKVLTREAMKLLRFDGRILDPAERQSVIDKFQTDSSITCLLLTTQVGSVGLNLTGADRVVIFDPSWNPGNDAQAIDRAYRIGQNKDVIIYRLITCGTIEEKIYRKQIFKDSISKQTTGSSKNPLRYFARNQLRDLFIMENPRISETHGILKELHGEKESVPKPNLQRHVDYLNSLNIYGISDHCMVFSKEAGLEKDSQYDSQVIEQAKRAEELVTAEVELCDKISNMSLNENAVFKPTREDIRRYMPNYIKEPKPTKTEEVICKDNQRLIIPDSPSPNRAQVVSSSECKNLSLERHEKTGHFTAMSIVTIEDSLTSTPCEGENELDALPNETYDIPEDRVKVEDSHLQASLVSEVSPCEGGAVVGSGRFIGSYIERTVDYEKLQNSFENEKHPAHDNEVFVLSEPGNDPCEGARAQCEVNDVKQRLVFESETSDHELASTKSPVFCERIGDDSSNTDNCCIQEKSQGVSSNITSSELDFKSQNLNSDMMDGVESEEQFMEQYQPDRDNQSIPDSCISEVSVGISHQISFAPDHITDAGEESMYEVVDVACSPINSALQVESKKSPVKVVAKQDQSPDHTVQNEELQSFRDLRNNLQRTLFLREDAQNRSTKRRDLRRSALALMHGLAEDPDDAESKERSLPVNVSMEENGSLDLGVKKKEDLNRMSTHSVENGLAPYNIFNMNAAKRLSSKQPGSLEPTNVHCSTPEDGQYVPSDKYFHSGILLTKSRGSFGRLEGLGSGSEGSNQNQGSASLFSSSAISDELKSNAKGSSSKLSMLNADGSNGALASPQQGEPLGHLVTGPMHTSNTSSNLESHPECSCIGEEAKRRCSDAGGYVPVISRVTVCEENPSWHEGSINDNCSCLGHPNGSVLLNNQRESLCKMNGLGSGSECSNQYQGSETLFSSSALSEELKCGVKRSSSKFSVLDADSSGGALGPSKEVEPVVQVVTDSMDSFNSSSESEPKRDPMRIKDINIECSKAFNIDIQEQSTFVFESLIKNPSISDSNTDLESDKSDRELIINDDAELVSDHSNGYPQLAKSNSSYVSDEDPEIEMKAHSLVDRESENHDYTFDFGSISSNEKSMISVFSDHHQSPVDQNASDIKMIESYPISIDDSDSSDSDDEQLIRSRKSFRKSIISFQGQSEALESPERFDHSETNGSLKKDDPSTGNLLMSTCEKHGSSWPSITKCPCMLSNEEFSEYEKHSESAAENMVNGKDLERALALIKALKVADHDLEMRRELAGLGLKFCDSH